MDSMKIPLFLKSHRNTKFSLKPNLTTLHKITQHPNSNVSAALTVPEILPPLNKNYIHDPIQYPINTNVRHQPDPKKSLCAIRAKK